MRWRAAVGLCVALAALLAAPAAARETRQVGPYRISVGMRIEPAYTDERNGVDLVVRRAGDGAPVEGLEKSLQVELTAPGGQRRAYALRAIPEQPGRYTTDWVLTRPGVYRIRVFGYVGSLRVDETFTSPEVLALVQLRFPDGTAPQGAALEVTGVWARPALAMAGGQGQGMMAGATSALYMTLTNRGSREVRVVGVRTPVARSAELHETRIEGMVARMQPVDAIRVPAGQQVRLQPGGLHVMLVGLRQDLKIGDRFPVTLVLDDGEEVAVEAVVQAG